MRLLWVGDAVAQTGFSRVTHSVLDNLPKDDCEVFVLGVNHMGDPHGYGYAIWPARLGGDLLGYKRLMPLVKKVKPDVVVLFNDIWVVSEYIKILKENEYTGKIMTYFPVDADEYDLNWIKPLYETDSVLVYTNWAVDVLKRAGYKGDCHVVPHGVDVNDFFPMDKQEARGKLAGLGEDDFIVFNGNRNQPRKRIDITIKGFCKFAEGKSNARLYLHMGVVDNGWPLIPLMGRQCRKYGLKSDKKLVLTDPHMTPQNMPSIETLNTIYNTADVGINTSLGEGWGLISFEHSACGIPQIVPDFSATRELYKDKGTLLPIRYELTAPGINTEGGLVHEDDVADALEEYYHNPELREKHASAMYKYVTSEKFDWKHIAKVWDKHIRETIASW